MTRGRGSRAELGRLIEGVLRKSGLYHRFKQAQVMLDWKEIVGPANARHSWPVRLSDGVLQVGCSSAGWAQTLTMLKAQIMEKIAARLGECALKDIQFRGVSQRRAPAEADDPAAPSPPGKIALQVEQLAWIRKLTEEIEAPVLRRKAEAALGSLLRQRQWHEKQGNRPCGNCGRLHRGQGQLCATCRKPPQQ